MTITYNLLNSIMRDLDKGSSLNHILFGTTGKIDLNLEIKFTDNLFKQVDQNVQRRRMEMRSDQEIEERTLTNEF